LFNFYYPRTSTIISWNFGLLRIYTVCVYIYIYTYSVIAQLSLGHRLRVPLFRVTTETRNLRERIELCREVVFITRDEFAMEIPRTRCFKWRDHRKSTSNSPLGTSSFSIKVRRCVKCEALFTRNKKNHINNKTILLKAGTVVISLKTFSEI